MVDSTNLYCFKFDVPSKSGVTATEFSREMNDFLREIDNFNYSIISGTLKIYTVTSHIENSEADSVKWWLQDELSWKESKDINKTTKKSIISLLKNSKTRVIKALSEDDEQLTNLSNKVVEEVNKAVQANKVKIPVELSSQIKVQIDEKRLLSAITNMSKISKNFGENVSYIDDFENGEETVLPSGIADYDTEDEKEYTDQISDSLKKKKKYQELVYYLKNKEVIQEKYNNKYVVIKDCQVVMSGDDEDELIDSMIAKNHQLGDFLVHFVSEESDKPKLIPRIW